MKHLLAMGLALAISLPGVAQTPGHEAHAGHAAEAPAPPAGVEAAGQVKSLDVKSGKVTLHHGPIPALGWPAMTMTFQATSELLKNVKVGQNVRFTLKTPGNEITSIQAQ